MHNQYDCFNCLRLKMYLIFITIRLIYLSTNYTRRGPLHWQKHIITSTFPSGSGNRPMEPLFPNQQRGSRKGHIPRKGSQRNWMWKYIFIITGVTHWKPENATTKNKSADIMLASFLIAWRLFFPRLSCRTSWVWHHRFDNAGVTTHV